MAHLATLAIKKIPSDSLKQNTSASQNTSSSVRDTDRMNSDSGCSAIANSSKEWPYISLITKIQDPVLNGNSRKRFPDPSVDKSILLACYGPSGHKEKLRLCKNLKAEKIIQDVFMERNNSHRISLKHLGDCSRVGNCSFFVSLDALSEVDNEKNIVKSIQLCNIREHTVAMKILPDELTGFWVRFSGPRKTFCFHLSLWQVLHKEKKIGKKKRESFLENQIMKVNELKFHIKNTGVQDSNEKRHNHKKRDSVKFLTCISEDRLTDYHPSFCSREKYRQIIVNLRECIENGKFTMFTEMYNSFCRPILVGNGDRDAIELKLLLSCEKSLFHAYQGEYTEAKKLLRYVVENVVGNSPNKCFLLNRAYLNLARVHLMEDNCGMAEECLCVLRYDKKNGCPSEDVSYFYALNAVALMLFSKKLPHLMVRLRTEALREFEKAQKSLLELLPMSLNLFCWLVLHKARIFICKHYADCCYSNLHSAEECVQTVKMYGEASLSEKSKCQLKLIESECAYFRKDKLVAETLIEDADLQARKLNFKRESFLCETFRAQRDISCNEIIHTNEMSSLEIYTSCKKVGFYNADESSF